MISLVLQSKLRASPGPEVTRRASSPSHDLIQKWRDNVTSQSPRRKVSTQSLRDRSESRSRQGQTRSGSVDHLNYSRTTNRDSRKPRNRSISNLTRTARTRSPSRSSTHSPVNHPSSRSRSYSRPGTPTPVASTKESKATQSTFNSIHSSPRKDKRHAHGTPTRIPAPTSMIKSHDSGAMISSTSTCNSMDSLKTVWPC